MSASKRIGLSKSPARKRSRIPTKSSSDAGSTDDSQQSTTAASAPASAPVRASVRTRPATHAPAPSPSPALSSDHPAASSPDRSAAPSPDHPAATLPNHLQLLHLIVLLHLLEMSLRSPAGRRKQEKLFLPANDEQDVAYWYRDNPLFYDRTQGIQGCRQEDGPPK